MTIIQYETVRNRLDGILGSKSEKRLKYKRLSQVLADLMTRFDEHDNRFVKDLYLEIVEEMVAVK